MVDELEMLPVWAGRKKEAAQPPDGFAATLDQGPKDLVEAPLPLENPNPAPAISGNDPLLLALEQLGEGDEHGESTPPSENAGAETPIGQVASVLASPSSTGRLLVIAALSLMAGLVAGYLYLVFAG